MGFSWLDGKQGLELGIVSILIALVNPYHIQLKSSVLKCLSVYCKFSKFCRIKLAVSSGFIKFVIMFKVLGGSLIFLKCKAFKV